MADAATPERRLGRPPDVASAETHGRLLREARRAFAVYGFDATTNKRIAAAAGITPGAIYHYYPSKADLYVAVYDEVQTVTAAAFDAAVSQHRTLIAQFGAVLDAAVELDRDDPSVTGFVLRAAGEARRHPELRESLRKARSMGSSFLHGLAHGAFERGELAPDVSPKALEDLLDAVLSGLARFSNQTGDAERHAGAVDVLQRFLSGTLMKPSTR